MKEIEFLKLLEPCVFKHEYNFEDGTEGEPVDVISIDNLKSIILSERLLISRSLNISVTPDFWRTFNKKLTEEYKIICINSRLAEKDFESRDYLIVKKILEPIIDSFIKTFEQLDNLVK